MLFYTVGQAYVFAAAVAAGVAMGAWYDVLRLARGLLQAGRWLSLAADVVFGLGVGLVAIACAWQAAYGELRLYAVVGMALGCALYLCTVSRALRHLLRKTKRKR